MYFPSRSKIIVAATLAYLTVFIEQCESQTPSYEVIVGSLQEKLSYLEQKVNVSLWTFILRAGGFEAAQR
jgi:hypothetical protein